MGKAAESQLVVVAIVVSDVVVVVEETEIRKITNCFTIYIHIFSNIALFFGTSKPPYRLTVWANYGPHKDLLA